MALIVANLAMSMKFWCLHVFHKELRCYLFHEYLTALRTDFGICRRMQNVWFRSYCHSQTCPAETELPTVAKTERVCVALENIIR